MSRKRLLSERAALIVALVILVPAAICFVDMSYQISGTGEANYGAWGLIGLAGFVAVFVAPVVLFFIIRWIFEPRSYDRDSKAN